MRVGVSGCLLGAKCNFDGNDLLSSFLKELEQIEEIEFVPFCPEDFVFGTPRANLRIVGGDGDDVLDGKAMVVNEHGEDVTALMIKGAYKFLNRLAANEVHYAILMDGSPSCGSNVILKEENWPNGGFKKASGVAAALLRRNGIIVFSSFDHLSISHFLNANLETYRIRSENLQDLKDSDKFKDLL